MEAKATWHDKMSFTGTADSGFEVPLGTAAAVGGDEDGFRPMELIAIGLAGCTAMDVISILKKKRQDVTGFDVQVHAERAKEHPRVFTSAVIEYTIIGHKIAEAAVVRSMELSASSYCPAQDMLGKVFPMTLKYQIFEDEGDGKHTLVTSGTHTPKE